VAVRDMAGAAMAVLDTAGAAMAVLDTAGAAMAVLDTAGAAMAVLDMAGATVQDSQLAVPVARYDSQLVGLERRKQAVADRKLGPMNPAAGHKMA